MTNLAFYFKIFWQFIWEYEAASFLLFDEARADELEEFRALVDLDQDVFLMFLVLLNLFRLFALLFLFESLDVAADLCAQLELLLFNSLFFLRELLHLQVKGQLHLSFFFLSSLKSLLLLQLLCLVALLHNFFNVCGWGMERWFRKELFGDVTDNQVILCPSSVRLMSFSNENFWHKIVGVFSWLIASSYDSEVFLGLAILLCQGFEFNSLLNLFFLFCLLSHLNS